MTTKEWIATAVIFVGTVIYLSIFVITPLARCANAGGLPVASVGYIGCAQEHKR